tara:strand:+ start:759 stop:1283 length:525 start_codon:yes stop_codon:yes gene_type:complete
MIRILAGKYKNKKLKHFNFTNVRPTQARVKKSMFDSLRNIKNKKVLDLFCGVGTIGIEAISRGAASVTFVDNNYKAINLLKENLSLIPITTTNSIVCSDVFKFLNKETNMFDIIIADPPYNKYFFIDFLPFMSKILCNQGIFCYETNKKEILTDLNLKVKKFGNTQLIFWRNDE